jgi:toxin FitB
MTDFTDILVDTNTISELQRKRPDEQVVAWFNQRRTTHLYISSFSIAEIETGIHYHRDPQIAERLRAWLEGIVLPRFANRILPFDTQAARVYGRWAGDGKKREYPLSVTDAQIAAIAYTRGLTVATRNTVDFENLPIRLINPWL